MQRYVTVCVMVCNVVTVVDGMRLQRLLDHMARLFRPPHSLHSLHSLHALHALHSLHHLARLFRLPQTGDHVRVGSAAIVSRLEAARPRKVYLETTLLRHAITAYHGMSHVCKSV